MGRDLAEYIKNSYQNAIDYHYIQTYYQPVIRTITGQLCGFEALARWLDPAWGLIYPDEFIPVMEQNHTIHLLDACVIRQACAQLRIGINEGKVTVPVSVNISRLDFMLCDVYEMVDGIVSEYQIPHDYICVEITESVMAEEREMISEIVGRFRAAGYQVWMDDFGSAYSSLNVLKDISFDELKLDMCFLHPFNQRAQRIATSVIEMAKKIDIHTLAEGVETEEQFHFFRDIGCEKVQGYYFGRPMPYQEALDSLLKKGIGTEQPHERKYYDEIGWTDVLSAVPFMTGEERDSLVSARMLNSIPLAMVEFCEDSFRLLFYNSAFEETFPGTGLFAGVFSRQLLGVQQPNSLVSDKILNLMDSVREGGEGRMLFTSRRAYYEIQAKCISRMRDRYCVLMRVRNLTKASKSESTDRLDDLLRRIYALYERITLMNIKTDTIIPLYTATREDLVSGRTGIRKLAEEYADRYLYPEDREEYLRFSDPAVLEKVFGGTGRTYVTRFLRTNIRHGQFAWKEYTVLQVDDDSFIIMIRNVHNQIIHLGGSDPENAGKDFTPSLLWNNLVRSDLLRLFWKDEDRRFLGASRAFLDYYGFVSEEDIIGKNDEQLGWHIHPDRYMNDEIQVIHEGVTTHNVPGLCMNDGENKEILASKTPLYDENGQVRGLMGYFIDRSLLTVNDRRGNETPKRDMLSGLLNERGIFEEASAFRDEYYLRGVDFVRIHVSINDFGIWTKKFGFDFGDKLIVKLGRALKRAFGRTCAVGRYVGSEYVLLHQVETREEAGRLRARIKEIGESIKEIGGLPVTLYLSVGYVLFSEFEDIEEQAQKCEVRVLADHDNTISPESRLAHASEIFHLFDDLPVSYSVYHFTHSEQSGSDDAIIFYVNHTYEKFGGKPAASVTGHSVRELYPHIGEDWYNNVRRAALYGEAAEGIMNDPQSGKKYRYTARQIIYPGYCAVIYQEI